MKWRLFRHLHLGGDPDAERVYRWHIAARDRSNRAIGLGMDAAKATLEDYLRAAQALYLSMAADGFHAAFAIPLDPNGDLLGGAHRTVCALALDIPKVPVERRPRIAWAPVWGEAWFIDNGMGSEDLARLRSDFAALADTGSSDP